ncbi:MAG: hypothetical protein QOI59_3428 [Gammaproteobacteria bacterium]|nr:hypothetical protein [Gammaproteobacteria bacterium]
MTYSVSARIVAHVALLCTVGGSVIATAPASAASKTLSISGKPASTVMVAGNYSFQPTAKDTVRSRIKFDIYNKPAWATFDGTTGHLYGSPNRRQVGTYSNITIRLTDWYGFVTTKPFSITVTSPPVAAAVPVNAAPTISGHAVTAVNAGAAFTFTPTAADANHDSLTFSVTNLPGWAKFNTASGTVSGTPGAADVGTYANIQISVSDSHTRVALPAFTVAVNQMSAGNAALDWTPPTENNDGSVLTNLAGYKVHYGNSPTQLTQVIKVSNPGLTAYVVEDLSPGTWYFTVTSYASDGTESVNSAVVSTKIG